MAGSARSSEVEIGADLSASPCANDRNDEEELGRQSRKKVTNKTKFEEKGTGGGFLSDLGENDNKTYLSNKVEPLNRKTTEFEKRGMSEFSNDSLG